MLRFLMVAVIGIFVGLSSAMADEGRYQLGNRPVVVLDTETGRIWIARSSTVGWPKDTKVSSNGEIQKGEFQLIMVPIYYEERAEGSPLHLTPK